MGKRGRPRAKQGLGLETEIKVRVMPTEKGLFAAAAAAYQPAALTVSAWIRRACMAQVERQDVRAAKPERKGR